MEWSGHLFNEVFEDFSYDFSNNGYFPEKKANHNAVLYLLFTDEVRQFLQECQTNPWNQNLCDMAAASLCKYFGLSHGVLPRIEDNHKTSFRTAAKRYIFNPAWTGNFYDLDDTYRKYYIILKELREGYEELPGRVHKKLYWTFVPLIAKDQQLPNSLVHNDENMLGFYLNTVRQCWKRPGAGIRMEFLTSFSDNHRPNALSTNFYRALTVHPNADYLFGGHDWRYIMQVSFV